MPIPRTDTLATLRRQPKLVHTLTADDQHNQHVIIADPAGQKHWLRQSFGPILVRDIGKRVYAVLTLDGSGYILQVENDEQLAARLDRAERRSLAQGSALVRTWLESD